MLLEEVAEAGTIATLKKYLESYIDGTGLKGYGPNSGGLDQCRWDMLACVGKLGRKACFHAGRLYDSNNTINNSSIDISIDNLV